MLTLLSVLMSNMVKEPSEAKTKKYLAMLMAWPRAKLPIPCTPNFD
jgi:hypothetical protein